MQRVRCLVRLNGDLNNTVQKEGVSPAEIVILNDIHGGTDGEAVVNIQPTHMDKDSHAKERGRLRGIYGHHVVDRLFPGEFSRLPVTLKDLEQITGQGADEDFDGEEEGDEGDESDQPQEGETDEAAAKRAAEAARKRAARAKAKADAEAAANANQGGNES